MILSGEEHVFSTVCVLKAPEQYINGLDLSQLAVTSSADSFVPLWHAGNSVWQLQEESEWAWASWSSQVCLCVIEWCVMSLLAMQVIHIHHVEQLRHTHRLHFKLALIKTLRSTGWLINTVTSAQLTTFYTLQVCCYTPSQVISWGNHIKSHFSC